MYKVVRIYMTYASFRTIRSFPHGYYGNERVAPHRRVLPPVVEMLVVPVCFITRPQARVKVTLLPLVWWTTQPPITTALDTLSGISVRYE